MGNLTDDNIKKKRVIKLLYNIGRNIYPALLIISSVIVILLISIVLLTKSQWFRYWASGFVFTVVNSELEEGARFEFKDINITYLLGIELSDVSVTLNGDTVLFCKSLEAGIRIRPLLSSRIVVNETNIISPRIRILRSVSDSLWNITKIYKPIPDTIPKKPPKWLIEIKEINLKNGNIALYDSTVKITRTGKLDFNHFNLRDVNLSLNAEIDLYKSVYDAKIKHFSFYERNAGVTLKNFQLVVHADSSEVALGYLYVETETSEFDLSAKIRNYNFLAEKSDFYKANLSLNIDAEKFNSDELSKFLPSNLPVSGVYASKISAYGKLNDLNVNVPYLSSGKSKISFTGYLKNVTNSSRFIKVDFKKSNIFKNDAENIFKNLSAGSLPQFEELNIINLVSVYHKDSLSTQFDFRSSLGNIDGKLGLNFGKMLSYNGRLNCNSFDISKILHNESLKSSINAHTDFSGSGTDAENLSFNFRMDMSKSFIREYTFNHLLMHAGTSERGIINLDTFWLSFTGYEQNGIYDLNKEFKDKIAVQGKLNFKNIKYPKYDLLVLLKNVSMSKILGTESAPENLDAKLTLIGEGFEPDSIKADINCTIQKWKYRGNTMTPQTLAIKLNRENNGHKSVYINSGFANVQLKGNFYYSDLISAIENQINYLSYFIREKANNISPENSSASHAQLNYTGSGFKPSVSDFMLTFSMKDNELIRTISGHNNFDTDMDMTLSYSSDLSGSSIKIDKLNINKLNIADSNITLTINKFTSNGLIKLNYPFDNQNKPQINLNFISMDGITYNKLSITGINSNLNFSNDKLHLDITASMNEMLSISATSDFVINNNNVYISFDKLNINYSDKLLLINKEKININYSSGVADFTNFKLTGKSIGLIDITGKAGFNKFDNLKISVLNYNLNDLWTLVPLNNLDVDEQLKGIIDSLVVVLDGSFDKTDIVLSLGIRDLKYSGNEIGNFVANLSHHNSQLKGTAAFTNKTRNILQLNLEDIPLNLSLGAKGKRFDKGKYISFSLVANKFPLEIFSPFVSGIQNLKGYADIMLSVSGNSLKDIDYAGKLSYSNTHFLVDANNMFYASDGAINFKNDTINIEKIRLMNSSEDLKGGEVSAKGNIVLDGLKLKYIDVSLSSNKIKVLSHASMKSMPSLYGDFVISFGPKPLHFFGSLDMPYLRGDVNIMRAELIMTNTKSLNVKKSKLKYEIIGANSIDFTYVPDSLGVRQLTPLTKVKEDNKNSFGDLLDIDIGIKFKGRFVFTMDIPGLAGQLFAEIGFFNPEDVLRYVKTRGIDEPKIYGTDIVVKEGSSLKLFKTLDTRGLISFPKGVIDNPGLDLIAKYYGQRYNLDKSSENYTVTMYIKGTMEQPFITFAYSIDGVIGTGDSSKINEDALLLLTIGKTSDELQGSGTGNYGGLSSATKDAAYNISTSTASSVASTALTEFVQSSGFIQSADIDIGNSLQNLDQTKMKLSGEIQGFRWTLGGSVADFANSNEISIDIPFTNNIMGQMTKSTISNRASTSKVQKDWEIKIKFGWSK